jgi:ribose/xylose/arabinose/galactoside ABC-type transport system permease subunit
MMIAFVLYGMTQSDQFYNFQTWINILRNAAFTGMVASFASIVIVSGGLDLSVGSVFAAGAMSSAALAFHGYSTVTALVCGVLLGAGLGLLNGTLVNLFDIPAIIVTLGTLFGVRSLDVYFSQGNSIGPLPERFVSIAQGEVYGIPYLIFYAVLIGAIAHVILHYMNFGWDTRAIGGNREAARSMGISVRRVSVAVYILSGAAAALAGAFQAARLGSGSPGLGSGFELQVIAAAIIGGTSISGGIGTVPGALLGALLLSVLGTGLVLLRVDPALQDLATGIVLILASGLDQLRRKQMFRASARRSLNLERSSPGEV